MNNYKKKKTHMFSTGTFLSVWGFCYCLFIVVVVYFRLVKSAPVEPTDRAWPSLPGLLTLVLTHNPIYLLVFFNRLECLIRFL